MPVSKKRKKDGKPVQHRERPGEVIEHPHGPDAATLAPQRRVGKPSNPFVSQQQAKRGAQRGR
jgi:hypothetical protein